MIDKDQFKTMWRRLCKRFNRELDAEEADNYFRFLEDHELTTGQMLAAAHALWATREFFPRPADFVIVGAAKEWEDIVGWALDRLALPPALTDGARAALKAIGGRDEIQQSRSIGLTRKRFLDAYELHISEVTFDLANARIAAADTRQELGMNQRKELREGGA